MLTTPPAIELSRTLAIMRDAGLEAAGRAAGVQLAVGRVGSALTPFLRSAAPTNYDEARESDTETFARFHRALLDRGVMAPPSQFEAWFISLAHDEALIDQTVDAAAAALTAIRS